MKTLRILLIAALAVAASCDKGGKDTPDGPATPEVEEHYVYYPNSVKVMSFNVRYLNTTDGDNVWSARRDGVFAMMASEKPLVMGTQECKWQQRTDILEARPEYAAIGVCRDDGKEGCSGETMTIFYQKDSVILEKWGTYWLSATPDVPSKGWDGACKRCATWGIFKIRSTGQRFFYTNTHLDHKGTEARTEGAKLLVTKTLELNPEKLPVILTADFNAEIPDEIMQPLKTAYSNARACAETSDNTMTFQSFGKSSGSVIDHIFYDRFKKCIRYRTVNDSWAGVNYISDHYPIYAILQY